MISTHFKNLIKRFSLASLALVLSFLVINACTIKHDFVRPGTIPKLAVPNAEAEEFGNALFQELCEDYALDTDSQKYDQLVEVFDELTNLLVFNKQRRKVLLLGIPAALPANHDTGSKSNWINFLTHFVRLRLFQGYVNV